MCGRSLRDDGLLVDTAPEDANCPRGGFMASAVDDREQEKETGTSLMFIGLRHLGGRRSSHFLSAGKREAGGTRSPWMGTITAPRLDGVDVADRGLPDAREG